MLMSGSWHIYRPGEAWKRGCQQMRVAIYTEMFVAVAFQVPIAEFHSEETLPRHRTTTRLGPDVLSPAFDGEVEASRIAARPEPGSWRCASDPIDHRRIGQRLQNQRYAAPGA
jgi:endonuclease VIII